MMGTDAFGRCKECYAEVTTSGGCLECMAHRIYIPPLYGQLLDGSWGVVDHGYDGPAKHYQEWWRRRVQCR